MLAADDPSLLFEDCDILAPCATGAVLNPQTIPKIKAGIICGAANNQLEDPARDDRALYKRGIVYVPDFLTNHMGIVNCANEQYGYVGNDHFIKRHLSREWPFSIFQTAQKVLKISKDSGNPPAKTAIGLADELAQEKHPIFGHRGVGIIASLRESWL